jgi:C4-dicarboxylate transporter
MGAFMAVLDGHSVADLVAAPVAQASCLAGDHTKATLWPMMAPDGLSKAAAHAIHDASVGHEADPSSVLAGGTDTTGNTGHG